MKPKNITIFANNSKIDISEARKSMEKFFAECGISVTFVSLTSGIEDIKIVPPKTDLAVSLGGDGTVLTCASILKNTNIPIFAVNLGSFGYLAEIAFSEYKEVFEEYITDKTQTVGRMRICVEVLRREKTIEKTIFANSALNDITVATEHRAKMAKLKLSIDGTFAANLRADGIIIATPSGSTAYNLSAGGPILDSSLNAIIVNPICSFTMGIRPLVISDTSQICLEIPKQQAQIAVTCDGHEIFELQQNDKIIITKNPIPTYFVKNNRRNFIEILQNKLNWAGGFNA